MRNHLDPASFAWGLAMGTTFGMWLRGTLDALLLPPPNRAGHNSNGNCVPMPPPTRRVHLDEGRVIRGNGHGGPSTPKPPIDPNGYRSMNFPDPAPGRQPTNPFTGRSVQEDET